MPTCLIHGEVEPAQAYQRPSGAWVHRQPSDHLMSNGDPLPGPRPGFPSGDSGRPGHAGARPDRDDADNGPQG